MIVIELSKWEAVTLLVTTVLSTFGALLLVGFLASPGNATHEELLHVLETKHGYTQFHDGDVHGIYTD
jgi:hypothetical protein